MRRRDAFTLIELLVSIAIVVILLGISLSAVQVAREASLRAASLNNLRQISLAMHGYAADHGGKLPTNQFLLTFRQTVFEAIVPYLGGASPKAQVRVFANPADPTLDISLSPVLCGYAYNWQVFRDRVVDRKLGPSDLQARIPDGTSNTFLLSEIYSQCNGTQFVYCDAGIMHIPPVFGYLPRPLTRGNPPVSTASEPGLTFQIRPCTRANKECGSVPLCHLGLTQTYHRGGILVALADGSTRTLAPSISERTYWAAVTPDGGETLGDDW